MIVLLQPPAPTLKLRNYRPKDKSIAYQALPRPSYNSGQSHSALHRHCIVLHPVRTVFLYRAAAVTAAAAARLADVMSCWWLAVRVLSLVRHGVVGQRAIECGAQCHGGRQRSAAGHRAAVGQQRPQARHQTAARNTQTTDTTGAAANHQSAHTAAIASVVSLSAVSR